MGRGVVLIEGTPIISRIVFKPAPMQVRHPGFGREKCLEKEVTGAQTSLDQIDKDEWVQPVSPGQIFRMGHIVDRVVTYHGLCLRKDGQEHNRAPLLIVVP